MRQRECIKGWGTRMKVCTICAINKPLAHFHFRKETNAYRSACKSCANKDNLQRYHTSPTTKASHRKAARKYSLKRYGLTEAGYLEMHSEQAGGCAICNQRIALVHENRHQSSCVDHCHSTGAVRALLCWHCNIGLGKFFDSPNLLRKAADYIEATTTGSGGTCV